MEKVFHHNYISKKKVLDEIIANFDASQEKILKQSRNTIKLFNLEGETINIKSFKVPNVFNQIVYKYFRKSKAQRSFEYAEKLLELGIGTPPPIAYYKNSSGPLFKQSYYISKQLEYDLTFRELINDFNYPDYENILRAFTRFTFMLHEKGILFIDHSPGNTLIVKRENEYDFYLVDLNRMKFGSMSFDSRIQNFSRLSKYKPMVEIMSDEYAKCIGVDYETVFEPMWKYVERFRNKIRKKKRLKQIFKV